MGWMTSVQFPAESMMAFFLFATTGSGVYPASYSRGTRGFYPEAKQMWHEANYSPPSSTKVNNVWSYTSTSQYVFMAWYLVKDRDNFTFYI
jgi:hypothetical protein